MDYVYKMVELSPAVTARFGQGSGQAAGHLEFTVNEHAVVGWEFYRIDEFTIVENMGCGCLSTLFGLPTTQQRLIYVVTFRAPQKPSS